MRIGYLLYDSDQFFFLPMLTTLLFCADCFPVAKFIDKSNGCNIGGIAIPFDVCAAVVCLNKLKNLIVSDLDLSSSSCRDWD